MGSDIGNDILEAVADLKDIDSSDLEYLIGDYIDMDGIRLLANHDNSRWTLSFDLPDGLLLLTVMGIVL